MLRFTCARRVIVFCGILAGLSLLGACTGSPPPEREAPFTVEDHIVFDRFHGEHLGNLIYRPNDEEGEFIGWGRLPLQQWSYGTSSQTQLVQETDEIQYTDGGTVGNGEYRYTNGGTILDVDQDGDYEVIVGRGEGEATADSELYWYDDQSDSQYWEEHYIADTGQGSYVAPHDVEALTVELPSGETVRGVVGNIGREDVFFLETPEDPTDPWIRHAVGSFESGEHSGMEIVDMNADGRTDVVTGMFWIETPEDPRQENWTFHRYGRWDESNEGWGGMNMHGVADFDGDDELEIVVTEAEIPDARLAIFDRSSGDGTEQWNATMIEQGLDAPHSLVVADLNDDGHPDFVVGEMTAGGWNFPLNPNPTIWGYMNQGDGSFERYTISEGWGVHEMRRLPERRDGNIVLYAADEIQPQKFDGMVTPLNIWEISPVGSSE